MIDVTGSGPAGLQVLKQTRCRGGDTSTRGEEEATTEIWRKVSRESREKFWKFWKPDLCDVTKGADNLSGIIDHAPLSIGSPSPPETALF